MTRSLKKGPFVASYVMEKVEEMNAYGKKDTITMNKDKIVFMSVPKDEILKSYEQNTSRILTPKSSLITETNIPTLKK